MRYVALLRSINVGGHNVIKQADLRASFEALGFSDVETYIQSGNIVFGSPSKSNARLRTTIERRLAADFDYGGQAVVLSRSDYAAMLAAAPKNWGHDDSQKHNALFTLAGVDPAEAVGSLPEPKAEIEAIATGPGIIFWSISKERQTSTTYMKLPAHRVYQQVTVRNHRTTFKIRDMLG